MKFSIKHFLKNIPVIGNILKKLYRGWVKPVRTFEGSENYWVNRYNTGGNSGAGSYDVLAEYKAKILNEFVANKNINTIIEYGCGDGNQLKLAKYPFYLGFDISPKIINQCKNIFINEKNKKFKLMNEYKAEKADLTLSLDVIYHLVEGHVFSNYMNRLFDSSLNFVIIYSSDWPNLEHSNSHVMHRKFTNWVANNKLCWEMILHIPNEHPYENDEINESFADFYIYKKL